MRSGDRNNRPFIFTSAKSTSSLVLLAPAESKYHQRELFLELIGNSPSMRSQSESIDCEYRGVPLFRAFVNFHLSLPLSGLCNTRPEAFYREYNGSHMLVSYGGRDVTRHNAAELFHQWHGAQLVKLSGTQATFVMLFQEFLEVKRPLGKYLLWELKKCRALSGFLK